MRSILARPLQATVADRDLRILSLNTSELHSLTVGEVIHSSLREVEAGSRVVDSQNVDCLAVICYTVAGTALYGCQHIETVIQEPVRTCAEFQPSTP